MALLLALAPVAGSQGAPTVIFSKTFLPDTIGPGSVSMLTFDITNTDKVNPADDLAFSDTLPAGVTIAAPATTTDTCGGTLTAPDGGGTITFSDGKVGASSSCMIMVDVTSSTAGTHTNTSGALTSTLGNSGTATDDLTVDTSRPGFSKAFGPSTVDLGERSTLTFTVDNTANASDVSDLAFTDTLPTGLVIADPADASTDCESTLLPAVLTADPGTSLISFDADGFLPSFPVLAAGATCTVSVGVVATGPGTLANSSGELLSGPPGSEVSSGKANAALTVTAGTLHLTKEFTDDPVPPGATATLEFTINNFDRDNPATGVTFADTLPAGVTIATPGGATNTCGGTLTAADGGSTISLAGGTVPIEGDCTITVGVTSGTTGTHTNTSGTVSGTIGGSLVTGNTASDDLFVVAAPILTKEFTDDPVASGGTVTLQFTITDTTTSGGSSDIAFIDELTTFLPFPVTVTLPPSPDPPCGVGSALALVSLGEDQQGLSLTGGTISTPGGSCSFDVTITIPAGFASGTYVNTTSDIMATVDDETVSGGTATDNLEVVGAPGLSKEFTDDPVQPGGTVTLEFTLSHDAQAPASATGIGFTDNLGDAGGALLGLAATGLPIPACGGTLSGTTTLTFSGGTLALGASCTFSATLSVPAAAPQGIHTNATDAVTATVSGLAVTGLAATDDLTVADLTLTKSFTDDPVLPGSTVTLEFTIDNTSPTDDATAIVFTDDLGNVLSGLGPTAGQLPLVDPCGGGSSLSLVGDTLFLTGGNRLAGESCTFGVTLDVPAGATPDTYGNTTGGGTTPIPFSATINAMTVELGEATDDLVVASDKPSLTKTFIDDPVEAGDTATVVFTITNFSTVLTITDLAFTDDLDAALTGLAAVPPLPTNPCGSGSTLTGTSVLTLAAGSLAPGASCIFPVTVQTPLGAAPGSYTNTTSSLTATGPAEAGDPASDDLEILTVVVREADLSVTKTDDLDPAIAGVDTVVYTVTVSNAGPDDADVVVTDTLPAGVTLVSTSGCAEDPNGVPTCSLGVIGTGASKQYTVTVTVDSDVGQGTVLTNQVIVTSDTTDPDASNNLTSENTSVAAGSPEVGLFNRGTARWTLQLRSGSPLVFTFGDPNDHGVMGDWNGDGSRTPGVYRPSTSTFYGRNSNSTGPGDFSFTVGQAGDVPVSGDWNGNGFDSLALYRPTTQQFFVFDDFTDLTVDHVLLFGNPGDVPFAGDIDGDGDDDVAVQRPGGGLAGLLFFRTTLTTGVADVTFTYGNPGDRPFFGDWDHDSDDTIGIYRPGDATFYLRNSNTTGIADMTVLFGTGAETPVAGPF